MIGPFIQVSVLSDVEPFTFAVGIALVVAGFHLCLAAGRGYRGRKTGAGLEAKFRRMAAQPRAEGKAPSGIPANEAIVTASRAAGRITIEYWGEHWRISKKLLTMIGFAATIPYVIVLSAVGQFTYSVIVPRFSGIIIAPEWSWVCFAAAGGILGAWCAAKTQRFVPEHLLKLMLGGTTSMAGALYVLAFFVELPFRL